VRNVVALALILAPALAQAQTPPQGVALTVRRGFFTETDIGVFFALGGKNGYSNAQTYLQLGVGYDLSENIEIGAHFATAASAQNCYVAPDQPDLPCELRFGTARVDFPENFTLTYLDVTVAYLFRVAERFYIAPKLAGGWTFLDPAPVPEGSPTKAEDIQLVESAPNAGVGLGIEYATHMDHFSIGADVLARQIIGPNIPTIAVFGRVKYTF
jgi:hypothetical protein